MCCLMRSLFVSLFQIKITEWWLQPIKFFMRHVVKLPKFQNWMITLSMITMSGLTVVNKKHAYRLIKQKSKLSICCFWNAFGFWYPSEPVFRSTKIDCNERKSVLDDDDQFQPFEMHFQNIATHSSTFFIYIYPISSKSNLVCFACFTCITWLVCL